MAVALDREQVTELDAAEPGHPADVVPPEVHQHDVLGPLLRIGEQLGLQRLVFFGS